MNGLTIGTRVTPPQLTGTWSVWSKAAETPGAYFVVPADDQARATGVKYAVVKAMQRADQGRTQVTTLRTDPHIKGLLDD